jgi:hypothetical protein
VFRIDLDRIRERFRLRQYDMSAHAMEEMAEGLLTIEDIESAILSSRVSRIEKIRSQGDTLYNRSANASWSGWSFC